MILLSIKNSKIILTQTRMGIGRVIFPSKGPLGGLYVFIMAKSLSVYTFFSVVISGDSA